MGADKYDNAIVYATVSYWIILGVLIVILLMIAFVISLLSKILNHSSNLDKLPLARAVLAFIGFLLLGLSVLMFLLMIGSFG